MFFCFFFSALSVLACMFSLRTLCCALCVTTRYSEQAGLTDDEADFTVVIIVATRHHGSHRVIDHSHNINVKVLQRDFIPQYTSECVRS